MEHVNFLKSLLITYGQNLCSREKKFINSEDLGEVTENLSFVKTQIVSCISHLNRTEKGKVLCRKMMEDHYILRLFMEEEDSRREYQMYRLSISIIERLSIIYGYEDMKEKTEDVIKKLLHHQKNITIDIDTLKNNDKDQFVYLVELIPKLKEYIKNDVIVGNYYVLYLFLFSTL